MAKHSKKPFLAATRSDNLIWLQDPTSGLLSSVHKADLEGYRVPVHLGRITTAEILPSADEALRILNQKVFPLVAQVQQILQLSWVEHVYEESTGIEHFVVPAPLFAPPALKRLWLTAGYKELSDSRQFATQDGLQEALLSGADLGTKWH